MVPPLRNLSTPSMPRWYQSPGSRLIRSCSIFAFLKPPPPPTVARTGIDSSARLGRHRWVVERTLAWLGRYRRLTIRYERDADLHLAFLDLGCALICFNFLRQTFC